jgi:hypothetical protein
VCLFLDLIEVRNLIGKRFSSKRGKSLQIWLYNGEQKLIELFSPAKRLSTPIMIRTEKDWICLPLSCRPQTLTS